MCTVTLVPRRNGYVLAMNRDEQLAREIARPPAKTGSGFSALLCPSESGGGTWIAINPGGICLALINWYAVKVRVRNHSLSRGLVIRALGAVRPAQAVTAGLRRLRLDRINPFRLIGIFPDSRLVCEWRWDLRQLVCRKHPWSLRQWISSGFDEPAAQRARGRAFEQARRQKTAGSLDWLRRLHRSHRPVAGPFSTCMHRMDAATVSYTEAFVTPFRVSMRYHAGAPCQGARHRVVSMPRMNLPVERGSTSGLGNELFHVFSEQIRLEIHGIADFALS